MHISDHQVKKTGEQKNTPNPLKKFGGRENVWIKQGAMGWREMVICSLRLHWRWMAFDNTSHDAVVVGVVVCTARKALGKVKWLARIYISGAIRTCSTGIMEVILVLKAFHLFVVTNEWLLKIESGKDGRENRTYLRNRNACSWELFFGGRYLSQIDDRDAWIGVSTDCW